MYGRKINGKTTTFGTTGYTYNKVFVLYDRLTDSVWYPLADGAWDAIGGSKRGAKIPFLAEPPVVPLGEWRKKHPATEVLLEDASRLTGQRGAGHSGGEKKTKTGDRPAAGDQGAARPRSRSDDSAPVRAKDGG